MIFCFLSALYVEQIGVGRNEEFQFLCMTKTLFKTIMNVIFHTNKVDLTGKMEN